MEQGHNNTWGGTVRHFHVFHILDSQGNIVHKSNMWMFDPQGEPWSTTSGPWTDVLVEEVVVANMLPLEYLTAVLAHTEKLAALMRDEGTAFLRISRILDDESLEPVIEADVTSMENGSHPWWPNSEAALAHVSNSIRSDEYRAVTALVTRIKLTIQMLVADPEVALEVMEAAIEADDPDGDADDWTLG